MRVLIVLAALLAVANAFPSKFYGYSIYTASDCSGSPTLTFVYPYDTCIHSGTISFQTSLVGGTAQSTSYTTSDCSGTGTTSNGTADGCISGNKFITVVAPGNVIMVTTFSDANCMTVSSGPAGFTANGCIGSSGIYSKYAISGSNVQVCGGCTDTACTTGCTCANIAGNSCISAGGISTKYEFLGAATAIAPAASIVALVALVAAALF